MAKKLAEGADPHLRLRPDSRATKNEVLICSLLITFVTFSYMSPFVTIGSFVTYYNCKYGNSFYTLLNVCFYLPGLGVSVMQTRMDRQFDSYYGFKNTFFFRMFFSQCFIVLVTVYFAYGHKILMLCGSVLLGICTWTAHGTLSSLSSCFPPLAIRLFQFGMQLPNFYSFVMVIAMGLQGGGNNHAEEVFTDGKIQTFYLTTAGITALGIIATRVLVTLEGTSRVQEAYILSCQVDEGAAASGESLTSPLLRESSYASASSSSTPQLLYTSTNRPHLDSMLERMLSSSTDGTTLPIALRASSLADVYSRIRLHRRLLFLTIFSAILTGSFFSSVESPDHFNIAQALYFTRLAGDLGGRVIAILLPRPPFFDKRLTGLTCLLAVRLGFLVLFFVYIIPGQTILPLYDPGVIICVGLCACQSGFTTSLLYEYAANEFEGDSSARSETAKVLNMSFHGGCFAAVLAAIVLLVPLGGTFELSGGEP